MDEQDSKWGKRDDLCPPVGVFYINMLICHVAWQPSTAGRLIIYTNDLFWFCH